ncbi:MAG: hypothetical protein P8016_08260 [Sedimentisphaerales bacterium]
MANESKNNQSAVDFGMHIPPPANGAGIETLKVSELQLERYKSSVAERQQKIVKAESILTDWRTAVLKQVGQANWKKFIEYSNAQRQSQYGLKEFCHDPDDLAKLALAKRKARENSMEMLKAAKLEPGGLKSVHRNFAQKMDDLLGPREPKIQRLEMVPESKVPRAVFNGKSNPWTTRKPPFDGWSWAYSWTRWGGYNPNLVNYLNVASGSIGHRSEYQNYSASDWDGLWLEYDTNVGVWYWPPHAGKVNMWIKARCAKTRYSVWLDDEWGWSDSSTWMQSYITVNVSPAMVDEERSQSWWAHVWGNPDSKTYASDLYAPNTVKWFHLVSDPIPANAWTYVKVGTYDRHTSFINDVSTDAIMRNWWYIEELWFDVL